MTINGIKALTFDIGGTILDWHGGFHTAFVRRPDDWGDAGPPDPTPNPHHDIIVDSFPELADRLGA